jgi:putative transposase
MEIFPGRLAHQTPAWVESEATFHIRISAPQRSGISLVRPEIADALLTAARCYHTQRRWSCRLMLIMPDHLHALLTFPHHIAMAAVIGAWKGYQTKRLGIQWQDNFFDHRMRDHHELQKSAAYIRLNPVRKGLCTTESAWPRLLTCAD